MAEKNIKLFADFPPVSTEQWEAKINADLKGKDYEKSLVWRTNEGFNVRPYYRAENLDTLGHLNQLPGEFPYVRGTKAENNDWFIRQDINVKDVNEANAKALDVLNKGITSLGFDICKCIELTEANISALLNDIALECVELNFKVACKSSELIEALKAVVAAKGCDASKLTISVDSDPISSFTLRGKFCCEEEKVFGAVANNVKATADFAEFRAVAVNGKNINNAGASIVQELGYSLAMGAEYLAKLTEAGASIDEVANSIKFNFAVGGNYFMELAKLRAARTLWAQIVKAYAPASDDACKMRIHSETSEWNKTVYDPYVNMLRTQTEAMSAILGGTDSMTVAPFNKVYEETTQFSERIARNQQSLLKEESHFDKIVDPGAGSYYVETLTESISEQAWAIFLEVQEKGGFLAAFRAGAVQAAIKETATKRDSKVATRRENVLGVNQFPNFTETMDAEIAAEILSPADLTAEGAEVETLKTYRGAMAFEALRYQTDVAVKAGKKRPLAYMLTIGDLTFRKARAQFACNFFAVAGYSVQDNNGFASIEEGVAAAKEAGADIVVLCSSDDEYTEFGPAAFDAINGEASLVVAGAPKCADDLKAKGVENFISVRSNLLGELKAYQTKLGIN